MNDPVLREWLVYWPAWATLVEHVSSAHPATADPCSIYGSLLASDRDRLCALLYAHQHADSMDDGADLLDDLLLMARDGTRPRFGVEIFGVAL